MPGRFSDFAATEQEVELREESCLIDDATPNALPDEFSSEVRRSRFGKGTLRKLRLVMLKSQGCVVRIPWLLKL
jgi:hypothetical protein